jgi:Phytanoyl-CoA dioxygenase (PhyH)
MQKPLAVQSMYIFKQPRIGGKVGAHQVSNLLYCSAGFKAVNLLDRLQSY